VLFTLFNKATERNPSTMEIGGYCSAQNYLDNKNV
jgi:hypothetical protein